MNRDPFTGFGDDTNAAVKFQIRAPGGRAPDWEGGEPTINQWLIPGGRGRQVTQIGDPTPRTVTFELLLASLDDLKALKGLAATGTRATLRCLADITSEEGTIRTYLGTRYLELPNTLLMKIENIVKYPDGRRSADVTFQRDAETSSYVGFATTGEDV